MDIYIKEANGAQEIRIPWLPDKLQCISNGTRMASFDIINQGELNLPNGTNLTEFKWESKLPGSGHSDLPFLRGSWTDPKSIQTIWSKWRAEMTPLTLIVTGTPINHDVYLSDYNVTYEGGAGDYTYEIAFKARRKDINILVTTMQQTAAVGSGGGNAKSYTVVRGDTLWGIARRFFGSGTKWSVIYDANSSVIESTAKRYGKKSSDHGHWIYPGCVLSIPA